MPHPSLWERLSSLDPFTVLYVLALLVYVFGWWKPGRTVTDAVIALLSPLLGAMYDNSALLVGFVALAVVAYVVFGGWWF